ncbi:MAG: DNA polymerase III subunit chi [Steroidobacteraceae bacterium]
MPQVDFYILPGTDSAARLKFACRLIEKAYLSAQTTLVRVDDEAQLESIDTLLWTFADRAFVPHDRLGRDGTATALVMLTVGTLTNPPPSYTVLVDLALNCDAVAGEPPRLIEIVDADETRRRRGRERFRTYRDRGWTPTTHNIDQDS